MLSPSQKTFICRYKELDLYALLSISETFLKNNDTSDANGTDEALGHNACRSSVRDVKQVALELSPRGSVSAICETHQLPHQVQHGAESSYHVVSPFPRFSCAIIQKPA